MADLTYQPKVYLKQGTGSGQPDTQVIADGGNQNVESGGDINIESGGNIKIESGGFFYVNGLQITSQQLQQTLYDSIRKQVVAGAVGSTVLSTLNLPASIGLLIISMTSNVAAGSFWLTSVIQGREVILQMYAGSTASGSIVISTSWPTEKLPINF